MTPIDLSVKVGRAVTVGLALVVVVCGIVGAALSASDTRVDCALAGRMPEGWEDCARTGPGAQWATETP